MFVKLKTIPKNDRKVFHEDTRVNKIVNLLLNDDTESYREIIDVINTAFDIHNLQESIDDLIHINANPRFWEYIPFLWTIYDDRTQCANLRGALLERLVYKLLENKYGTDCDSNISCYVCIDSWISQKSVDVFFYISAEDFGESFECKVNPDRIEKSHIDNLKQIFIKSDEKIYSGIVAFASKKALERRAKELKSTIEPVQLFGWENLKEIAIKSFPRPT